MKSHLIVTTLLSFLIANTQATVLGNLAASMPTGTFVELTGMNGWNSGHIMVPTASGCTAGDVSTQFANKAVWNPVAKRFQFVGIPHGNCGSVLFTLYDDATNTWSVGPQPTTFQQPSHSYDHNTIDPLTGDMYYRYYGSLDFYRYKSGAWSKITQPNPGVNPVCCDALEFFPEMSRLVWWDTQAGLWAFNTGNNSWTGLANACIANNKPGLQNLNTGCGLGYFMEYSAAAKVLLFGDGTKIFKMDASATITTLNNAPMAPYMKVGTGGSTGSSVTVDPVSGRYLVITDGAMYEYNAAADQWKTLTVPSRPAVFTSQGGVGESLISAPISTYGVVFYLKMNDSDGTGHVYLYKHSPSTGTASEVRTTDFSSGLAITPNPFRTRVKLSLPAAARIGIYDLRGKSVLETRTDATSLDWEAKGLPGGIYLVRAQAGDKVLSRKITLMK